MSTLKLLSFILLSCLLHWLVMQLEFTRKAVFHQQHQSVGLVSRSAASFLQPAVEPKKNNPALPVQENTAPPEKPQAPEAPRKTTTPSKTLSSSVKSDPVAQPEKEATAKQSRPEETKTADVALIGIEETAVSPALTDSNESLVAADRGGGGEATGDVVNNMSTEPSSAVGEGPQVKAYQQALPRYELNPPPEYPEVAWRRGQEGTVQLEVLVLADGEVGEVQVLVSSGYKKLDRAALKAVQKWQFKAATVYGKAVDSRAVVPVDFVLE